MQTEQALLFVILNRYKTQSIQQMKNTNVSPRILDVYYKL